jgi:hypothetical protein
MGLKGFLRGLSQLLTKYKQKYAYFTHRHITEVINRKTFTDLRFVSCYPCKCHDFGHQFILTTQLGLCFHVT